MDGLKYGVDIFFNTALKGAATPTRGGFLAHPALSLLLF